MGESSKIEWTDSTWNPIRARNIATGKVGWHCEHVSEGCRNCYAEGMNRRLGTGIDFKPGHRKDIEIFLDETMLLAPLKWKKWSKPRTIFVCSMTDLFADFVTDGQIDEVFNTMETARQHRYQVLTKRAARMRRFMERRYAKYEIPGNVWLGVSAEDQANWDERKQHLRNTPAAVRFASFEPLLGAIVEPLPMSDFIQWAIVGGESGPHARPMHPDWARSLRDQCAAARVSFFFKQWGEWHWLGQYAKGTPLGDDGRMAKIMAPSTFPEGVPDNPVCMSRRGGKKRAGRLLDGVEHNGMPAL